MKAPDFTSFLAEEHIRLICWTLIHSLWIGLVAAALAGFVLMVTRRSSAHLRYQLLCGCLFAFVLVSAFVLFGLQDTGHDGSIGSVSTTFSAGSVVASHEISSNINTVERIKGYIDNYSPWLFGVWFVVFAAKILSLVSGLFSVHRIRTYKVHRAGVEWSDKIASLSARLGLNQTVKLLQSELVKVPLTVGHLKPVILIPMGMLFQLPAGQIETILLHELAHIRRRDYLVNIIQSVVETVFFFNPAVLWLSAVIREEREACCDDIVLANSNSKSEYFEALLAFHSAQPMRSDLTLGLGGNQLVDRLKRVINHENKQLNKMEKMILLGGLLIVSAFSYLPDPETRMNNLALKPTSTVTSKTAEHVDNKPVDKVTYKTVPTPPVTATSTVPEKMGNEVLTDTTRKFNSIRFESSNEDMSNRDMEARDDKGNVYNIKVEEGKVKSMKINGLDVPKNELDSHKDLVAEIDVAWSASRSAKRMAMERSRIDWQEKRRDMREQNWKKEQQGWHKRTDDDRAQTKWKIEKDKQKGWGGDSTGRKFKELNKEDWRKNERDFATKDFARKDFDRKEFDRRPEMRKERVTETRKGRVPEMRKEKAVRVEKRFEQDRDREKRDEDRKKDREGYSGYAAPGAATQRIKKMPSAADISADQARVKGIISALVDEKIIGQQADLEWFGLSEGELVVNGIKQKPELQQRLKAQYDIKPGHGLYYGPVKMSGKGVFLDKENLK